MSRNLRRRFLQQAAVALAAPYVITARAQETLIVNTQGGEYQELVERVVIRPFEKKFGVKVIHDPTGTASQDYAKIRASRGAPGFDVAGLLTPPEVILGVKEGLLEKLSEREVPNLKHLWDKTWSVIPDEGAIGLFDVACVPVGAKNKKLAYEFLNWRLDPAIQREWALAYFSSPTRPGVELPAKFAASQLTTQEQIARTQFPDSDVIGARRKDWTLKWQEIMG